MSNFRGTLNGNVECKCAKSKCDKSSATLQASLSNFRPDSLLRDHSHENMRQDDQGTSPEDPIIIDLTASDEFGNRTVAVFRHSVKLKFDRPEDENAEKTVLAGRPDETLNYHAVTHVPDLKNEVTLWQTKMLDDDVITTVMDSLQTLHSDFLFVNPCITQCILFAKANQVPLFLDPLVAKRYPNVFFVLNDNRRNSCSSHWSLLLYHRATKRFYHFDSMRNTNCRVAYELAQKLCEYLDGWKITDVRCEQQENSTDCGYYVIDYMLKLIYTQKSERFLPPSQIMRLPSRINKTKNYVVNLYLKTKAVKVL